MTTGPQPIDIETRSLLIEEIVERARAVQGDNILALALYGSTARDDVGPYSDIEMMCVLRGEGTWQNTIWVTGPWKAEVNFISQDIMMRRASEVKGDWSISHGKFLRIQTISDPEKFYSKMPEAVFSHPPSIYNDAIRSVITVDIYEWIGKLRNARLRQQTQLLPRLCLAMVQFGEQIIGLDNRYLYVTAATSLEESLQLARLPDGYEEICRMVMSGKLDDPAKIDAACEAFWNGVVEWAEERQIEYVTNERIPF
jgi:kanamycin nucleotidyltransferase